MTKQEMIDTLEELRENCKALDRECVDDPEEILMDINCLAPDAVVALNYCLKMLRAQP